MAMKKILLVDGNNLIFRSYYATAYSGVIMRNSKGFPTNALYGFINMMNRIIREEKPTYVLVAFDKGKTFRHEEYTEYKAGRSDTPDELKAMYFKIKGDYTRYIIELTPKDREEEYNILKDKVDEYYKTGLNLCESLSNLNTTKIGLILNYTVFLYEIVKDYKNAYIIANNTYQSITKSLNDDNYDSSLLKDLNKMLNLLKENISKWADTVVPEKVENIANDIKTENIEGTS